MSRRNDAERRANALRIDGEYIAWLMADRGYTMQEAIEYTKNSVAGVDKLRQRETALAAPRAQTGREKRIAYLNDQPEDVKRWARVDRACPYRGCLLPIQHSGPHKRPSRLMEMLENSVAELDAREKRIMDLCPFWLWANKPEDAIRLIDQFLDIPSLRRRVIDQFGIEHFPIWKEKDALNHVLIFSI